MEDGINYRKYLSVVKNVQIPTSEPTDKEAKNLLKKIKYGLRGENRNYAYIPFLHYNDALLKKVDAFMSPTIKKDCKNKAIKLVKDCDRLFLAVKDQEGYDDLMFRYLKAEIICPYSCAELKANLIMQRIIYEKIARWGTVGISFPADLPDAFEMIRDCRRVVALDPNNKNVYRLAMELLMEFGERNFAASCLRQGMIQLKPKPDEKDTVFSALYVNHMFSFESDWQNFQSFEFSDIQAQLNDFIERLAPHLVHIYKNKRDASGNVPIDAFVLNPKAKMGQQSFGKQLNALAEGWINGNKQKVHTDIDFADMWNKRIRDERKDEANGLIGKQCLTEAVEMYGDIINEAANYFQLNYAPKMYWPSAAAIEDKYQWLYAEKANLYLLRAGAYILMKTFAGVREAIRHLDTVLSLDASSDKAFYWTAWCYHRIKKRGRAMKNCKACLKIKPQHHKALQLLQRIQNRVKCAAGVNVV